MITIASFFPDPAFVLMAASFTLLIGLGVGQIGLISRAEGAWRWVAAIPTLVIALYVVTNTGAPRSAWPATLMMWSAAAAVAHGAIWFALRYVKPGQGANAQGTITQGTITQGTITQGTITQGTITQGTITELGAHCAGSD